MGEKLDFIKQFIHHPLEVGSVTPSSRYLIEGILRHVKVGENGVVVEFGAGTGIITKPLLASLPQGVRLFSFEINDQFVKNLEEIRDARLSVQHASVFDAAAVLSEQIKDGVDCIVSSIPLGALSQEEKIRLLGVAKNILKPGGLFIQYQYSLDSLKIMREIFSSVSFSFVLLNIPPAFVYRCVA